MATGPAKERSLTGATCTMEASVGSVKMRGLRGYRLIMGIPLLALLVP